MRRPFPAAVRLRLTIWYATSLLAAFLVAALALRGALRSALRGEFDASVRNTVALVQGFYRLERGEYGGVGPTTDHMARELVVPERALDFLRPDGSVLAVTPDYRDAGLARGAPHLVERIVALDPDRPGSAPGWRLRVRASAQTLDHSLERLDRLLLVAAPVALLLAAVVGWWITGRTLRPIREMAAATARIAGEQGTHAGAPLGRLPIADPDDEFGRLGTRVNALLARLDAALAQQRAFLADAAHELRTPVARMRSRVELALLDAPPGDVPPADAPPAVLRAIDADLARASRLVDELLHLARADATPTPATLVPGFLDDVVADAVSGWQAPARRAGVALQVSRLDEAPARLDATLLHRLVGVLVDNAIRYSAPGGRVDVRVRADDGHAVLEVEDDGIGIAPEERPRVWDRFYRGAAARAHAAEGSGLGLPIARWIVERHGAALELLAGPGGRGTLARASFPAAGPPGGAGGNAAGTSTGAAGTGRAGTDTAGTGAAGSGDARPDTVGGRVSR